MNALALLPLVVLAVSAASSSGSTAPSAAAPAPADSSGRDVIETLLAMGREYLPMVIAYAQSEGYLLALDGNGLGDNSSVA